MKPPQYEELDRGRQEAIPYAYSELCGSMMKYRLVEVPPSSSDNRWDGPLPRPIFEVRDLGDNGLVAEFYPNGHYQCHKASFQPYFRKIVDRVEKAGQEAYTKFMDDYERMRERF